MQVWKGPNDEKRIFNIIWNASADYDFRPLFVGMDIGGDPDFYMNIIIGLAYKIFPKEGLDELFETWKDRPNRGVLDSLTWLVLEQIVFKLERDDRLILANLRQDFARNFWSDKNLISRNSLALRNNILYDFYAFKTEEILGLKKIKGRKKNRVFYDKMTNYSYEDFDSLKKYILSSYRQEFFFLSYKDKERGKKGGLLSNLSLVRSVQLEYSMKSSDIGGDLINKNSKSLYNYLFSLSIKRRENREKEIEAIYGQAIFPEKKLLEIEQKYCIKAHAKLKLWYSRGEKTKGIKSDKTKLLLASMEANKKKNLERYKKNFNFYNREIENLSRKIQEKLLEATGDADDLYRSGALQRKLAWKMLATDQRKIFTKKNIEKKGGFQVDLLLDASASRINKQTDIAIEAYIMAESLYKNNIGVRIISYNTIYEYTNLLILKDWDDKPNLERILGYYPMGWNRDGLAYRAYLELLPEKIDDNYLTIVMTDVSPNDIKAFRKRPFNRPYGADLALDDSQEALHMIRRRGVRLSALITGGKASPVNARKLFNNNFISLNDIRQISSVCGRFIQKEIGRRQ
ncbi:MAG: hypothetical protein Q4E50_05630 [Tissierellia bacterium]|nr:hypothetical protein [Tissierellia bacterium]